MHKREPLWPHGKCGGARHDPAPGLRNLPLNFSVLLEECGCTRRRIQCCVLDGVGTMAAERPTTMRPMLYNLVNTSAGGGGPGGAAAARDAVGAGWAGQHLDPEARREEPRPGDPLLQQPREAPGAGVLSVSPCGFGCALQGSGEALQQMSLVWWPRVTLDRRWPRPLCTLHTLQTGRFTPLQSDH